MRDDVLESQAGEWLEKLGMPGARKLLRVEWNARLRSTAGYAHYPHWRIELNPRLRDFEGQVERTLKHELAHLIAYHRSGRRIEPHGAEWRLACADLGIPDERARHTLPLPRRAERSIDMARFFIDRPVFAWVIAIIIMLASLLSVTQLPISRYPDIAPPSVTVNATYPGASAQAVENSVTQVIEQAMTGLDGLQYMSSTSDANGAVAVTLTFANGTDPDTAQVQVQNKLQVATAQLPQIVQQQDLRVVTTTMRTPDGSASGWAGGMSHRAADIDAASLAQLAALRSFGLPLGVAYQLRDDLSVSSEIPRSPASPRATTFARGQAHCAHCARPHPAARLQSQSHGRVAR